MLQAVLYKETRMVVSCPRHIHAPKMKNKDSASALTRAYRTKSVWSLSPHMSCVDVTGTQKQISATNTKSISLY